MKPCEKLRGEMSLMELLTSWEGWTTSSQYIVFYKFITCFKKKSKILIWNVTITYTCQINVVE